MQKKFLLISALVLVAIGGLPATAAVHTDFRNLSTHSPSGPSTMPGMDSGSSTMPGMDNQDGTTDGSSHPRPLKPVLGVFGIATSAVLLGAGFLRRQDRAQRKVKQNSLASRRSQK